MLPFFFLGVPVTVLVFTSVPLLTLLTAYFRNQFLPRLMPVHSDSDCLPIFPPLSPGSLIPSAVPLDILSYLHHVALDRIQLHRSCPLSFATASEVSRDFSPLRSGSGDCFSRPSGFLAQSQLLSPNLL